MHLFLHCGAPICVFNRSCVALRLTHFHTTSHALLMSAMYSLYLDHSTGFLVRVNRRTLPVPDADFSAKVPAPSASKSASRWHDSSLGVSASDTFRFPFSLRKPSLRLLARGIARPSLTARRLFIRLVEPTQARHSVLLAGLKSDSLVESRLPVHPGAFQHR
jgi:hypothetical protein